MARRQLGLFCLCNTAALATTVLFAVACYSYAPLTSSAEFVSAKAVRVRYATPQRLVVSKGIGDTVLYEVTMVEGVPIRVAHDTLFLKLARWRAGTWVHVREPLNVAVTFGPTSGTVIDEEFLSQTKTTAAILLTLVVLAALAAGLLLLALNSGNPTG